MSNSSSPDPESPSNISGEIEGCSVERIGRRAVITLPNGVTIVTFGAVTITSTNREAAWRDRGRARGRGRGHRSGRICTRGPLHARGTIHLPAVPHSTRRRQSPPSRISSPDRGAGIWRVRDEDPLGPLRAPETVHLPRVPHSSGRRRSAPPRMLSLNQLERIWQAQEENSRNDPLPNGASLPEPVAESSSHRPPECSSTPAAIQSQCRDRNPTSTGRDHHGCAQLQKVIQLRDQHDRIFLQELDARLNELANDPNATIASDAPVPLTPHGRCKAVVADSNVVNLPNETDSSEQNDSTTQTDSDGFVMSGMTPDSPETFASDDSLRP